MYLLDTNVISEMRKFGTGRANAQVERWAASCPASSTYLSAITVLEMRMGVLKMLRKDAAQGQILHDWLMNDVLIEYVGRILPVDTPVALMCASLHVDADRSYKDSLIAATANTHGMAVVTRNVAHFAPMRIPVVNPWDRR
jgi:predicted nucleic acid-binding protein